MKTRMRIAWLLAILILATALVPALALADEDDDNEPLELEELDVELEDLPEVVKTTVLNQLADFELTELQQITTTEGSFYEAEWIDGDFEVEIKVAPDGTLLDLEREKAAKDEGEDENADDDADDDEDVDG